MKDHPFIKLEGETSDSITAVLKLLKLSGDMSQSKNQRAFKRLMKAIGDGDGDDDDTDRDSDSDDRDMTE